MIPNFDTFKDVAGRITVTKVATVVVLFVTISLAFGIGPIGEYADDAHGFAGPSAENESNADESHSNQMSDTVTSRSSDLDISEIEFTVHELVNEERANRELEELAFDDKLQTIARNHSEDMAERRYFDHVSPDGSGADDRYDAHGYSCRIDLSDRQYIDGGGENIAKTWHDQLIRTDDGYERYTTEDEIAEGLVNQWMNSPGHRENILEPFWENQGIGIRVTSEGEVFATQNFC